MDILDDSDGNRVPVSSIDTSYNYNDKEDHWEDGKSTWENVTLLCYAAGGRPLPRFSWQIRNTDLDDDDIFDNPSASNNGEGNVARSYGYNNVIQVCNYNKLTHTHVHLQYNFTLMIHK